MAEPESSSPKQGLRYDQGKLRWDLLPPDVMEELVRVYTKGAEKYAERNWELGMDWGKCLRALKSHLNKWEKGQQRDDEYPELYNLAMVMWNAAALLAYELRGIGKDNRPNLKGRDA